MSEKRKITTLTVDFKRKVIKSVEENPTKKKSVIAKEFNIPPTTLHTILKNKDKYEEGKGIDKLCKRAKKGEFNDVEQCVMKWLKQCRDKNVVISGPILQRKAQEFAKDLKHDNFRASNGWLQNFKKKKWLHIQKGLW
jgi:centromere protein B